MNGSEAMHHTDTHRKKQLYEELHIIRSTRKRRAMIIDERGQRLNVGHQATFILHKRGCVSTM